MYLSYGNQLLVHFQSRIQNLERHLRWSVLRKQLMAKFRQLFSQNRPSQMFDRVLNIALCSFITILVEFNNPLCTKFVVHLVIFFILPKIPRIFFCICQQKDIIQQTFICSKSKLKIMFKVKIRNYEIEVCLTIKTPE